MFYMTRHMLRRSRSCPSGDPAFGDSQALGRNPLHATSENLCDAAADDNESVSDDSHSGQGSPVKSKPAISAEIILPALVEEDTTAATTLRTEPLCELSTTSKFDKRRAVPIGVDFIQGTENIIIADCANRKVKIFDLEENLKVECLVGRGYGTLLEPVAACLNKQGHILVADRSGGNIKVFTSEGRLLTSFGRDLAKPRDICTSIDLETVIVADEKRQDVYLYTTYSTKCRKKLGQQSKTSISFSKELSVCSTVNHLIVCDADSQKLHVFDNHGLFLRELPLPLVRDKALPTDQNGLKSVALCHVWANTVVVTCDNNNMVLVDTSGAAKESGVLVDHGPPSVSWNITSNRAGLMGTNAHLSDIVKIYRYKP